jgi:hypothetical protein
MKLRNSITELPAFRGVYWLGWCYGFLPLFFYRFAAVFCRIASADFLRISDKGAVSSTPCLT